MGMILASVVLGFWLGVAAVHETEYKEPPRQQHNATDNLLTETHKYK